MSLSRKIREKKAREEEKPLRINPLEEKYDLSPPQLTREETKFLFDVEKKENCYMFISDGFHPRFCNLYQIVGFDEKMINRKADDVSKAFPRIWVNISSNQARRWLEQNLKTTEDYTTILVYSGNKKNKFLSDLVDNVHISSKMKALNKTGGLTIDEIVEGLANRIDIHPPANCLAALLKCSKNIKKSEFKKN